MMKWDEVRRRLVQRREDAKLTGKEAAAQVGVSHSYISNLENGHGEPGAVALFAALARLYGTSVDHLLGLTDNPGPPAGAAIPAYGREIMALLRELPEERRAELVGIGQVMVEAERQRAENDSNAVRNAQMLESALSPAKYQALMRILETSVRTGDVDTARREIARLLGGGEQ